MDRVVWTGPEFGGVCTGAEFVAMGRTDSGDGVAWTSGDGLTWMRLDTGSLFAGVSLRAAAQLSTSLGTRLVLFGTDRQGSQVVAVGGP
jgi:hypothetical protein